MLFLCEKKATVHGEKNKKGKIFHLHCRLSATKETKLQNFQYKFLMRIIPTNKFLLKCNIAMSALCDFCTMEIETINHLFWECLYVQQFWTELLNLLKDSNVDITFSLRTITFEITQRINYPNIQYTQRNVMISHA